jgi:molybdopterin-guanine dinucleotide biosynthesis protein A
LNGILTAFHTEPDTVWISVPVDMPGIDASSIKFLIDHRDRTKMATCFYDSDGQLPEPLFTIWEPEAKQCLFDFFYTGGVSPRQFLMTHNVQILLAPHPEVLVNINTQEDYTAFLKQSGKNIQEKF